MKADHLPLHSKGITSPPRSSDIHADLGCEIVIILLYSNMDMRHYYSTASLETVLHPHLFLVYFIFACVDISPWCYFLCALSLWNVRRGQLGLDGDDSCGFVSEKEIVKRRMSLWCKL